jgi:hypothetical protein
VSSTGAAPIDFNVLMVEQSDLPRDASSPGAIQEVSASVWPSESLPRPVVAPLAPERYKIQFTASQQTYDKLRRAQDLLRYTIPDGDVTAVFDRALTVLLDDLQRKKRAASTRPRQGESSVSRSRYIPAAVRRTVWERDAGQCTFVGAQGRCTERGFLEFHHVVPFAAGGEASAGNLTLRCRPHNQGEAEEFFGPLFAREARAWYDMEGLGPDRVSVLAQSSRQRAPAPICNESGRRRQEGLSRTCCTSGKSVAPGAHRGQGRGRSVRRNGPEREDRPQWA